MKRNSAFTTCSLSLALAASLFAPLAVSAETKGNNNRINIDTRGSVVVDICVAVDRLRIDADGTFSNLQGRIDAKRKDVSGKITDEQDKRDERIKALRDQEAKKLVEVSADLDAEADTDAEHRAVVVFRTEVKAAVTARHRAIDAANDTFRAGVKSALEARRAAVAAAIKKFNSSIRAAYSTAKTDCANSANTTAIRTNLQGSVTAARTQLKADLKAIDTMGLRIQPLITARRAAHAKAQADFKASLEAAKTKLKAAFEADVEVK